MLLGLLAGNWLKSGLLPKQRLLRLLLASAIFFALGELLHQLGICPIVKRIWTPSWVLFSGGWCFLCMAVLYIIVDWAKLKKWAFPLIVIGMNSIAAYLIAHLIRDFTANSIKILFGQDCFAFYGENYGPLCEGLAVLLVFWLILFWMYRRKIFLRI
jgi:heparan-alpha-glucosaminide N-acetyltransferase